MVQDSCPDAEFLDLRELRLRYTGADCPASANGQGDPGLEWACDGDPAGAEPVHIIVTESPVANERLAGVWFDGTVALDQVFSVNGALRPAESFPQALWVHVLDASGVVLQSIRMDDSCQLSLAPGDRFGAITVERLELR